MPDIDRGREFYRDVLGLGTPVYDLPEAGWIEFATGGAGNLAITAAPQGWAPAEGITVVLDTADCDAACAAQLVEAAFLYQSGSWLSGSSEEMIRSTTKLQVPPPGAPR